MKKLINAFIFQFIMAFPVQWVINHHYITIERVLLNAVIGTVIIMLFARKYILRIV